MTEIEQAISTLENDAINITGRLATDANTRLVQKLEAINLAQSALREKMKREKGCVWCKADNKVTHNGEHFCFFCSYCGKRLEVEHGD